MTTITHATEADHEQIHRLNHKIFAEEIPQHDSKENRVLVDRFHRDNIYLLAKRDEVLIGMLCYRLQRPFSLDQKLPDLDTFLPPHNKLAEVRLFCVEPGERNAGVGFQLMKTLASVLVSLGVDAAVISGTTRQTRLYLGMGFQPFGPLVGKSEAQYQPMFIHINHLRNDLRNDQS